MTTVRSRSASKTCLSVTLVVLFTAIVANCGGSREGVAATEPSVGTGSTSATAGPSSVDTGANDGATATAASESTSAPPVPTCDAGWGGEPCLDDGACCTNRCNSGYCESSALGDACRDAHDCADAVDCLDGVCACMPVGGACSWGLSCCSGACEGDVCVCAGLEGGCLVDEDCCATPGLECRVDFGSVGKCRASIGEPCAAPSHCVTDECVEQACACGTDQLSSCNDDDDCCGEGACLGLGIGPAAGDCCKPVGAACDDWLECCSSRCLPTGVCGCGAPPDGGWPAYCTADTDCCPGVACNLFDGLDWGYCHADDGCGPGQGGHGNPCTDGEDCCDAFSCITYCCGAPGLFCTNDGDCCSVACGLDGTCACSELFRPCGEDGDCCDGLVCENNSCVM